MNGIDEAIEQIGFDRVLKSMKVEGIGYCDVHGSYGMVKDNNLCPLCPHDNNAGNGTTASEVEHYLDVKELVDYTTGHNPGQKANPYGI